MELFNSEENFTHKTYDWKKYADYVVQNTLDTKHPVKLMTDCISRCFLQHYLHVFCHKKAYDFENNVIYHFDKITYDEYINYVLSHQTIKSHKYYQLISDAILNEVQYVSLTYDHINTKYILIEGNYAAKFPKDINWDLIFELSYILLSEMFI